MMNSFIKNNYITKNNDINNNLVYVNNRQHEEAIVENTKQHGIKMMIDDCKYYVKQIGNRANFKGYMGQYFPDNVVFKHNEERYKPMKDIWEQVQKEMKRKTKKKGLFGLGLIGGNKKTRKRTRGYKRKK
jgi:hypothetical protein